MATSSVGSITSPAAVAAQAFGSQSALARVLGLHPSRVSHWSRKHYIPAKYHKQILEAAWARGIDLTAQDLVFGRAAA